MISFDAPAYQRLINLAPEKRAALRRAVGSVLQPILVARGNSPWILDIGGGDGDLILSTITLLTATTRRSPPKPVIVEPSEWMRGALRKRASMMPHFLVDTPFDAACQLPVSPQDGFDVILASHVLYYIGDWEDFLARAAGLLSSDGVLCIVLKSRRSRLYELRDRLCFPESVCESFDSNFFSEDLSTVLRKRGSQFRTTPSKWTLSIELSHDGALPPEYLRILSFLLGVPQCSWLHESVKQLEKLLLVEEDGHMVAHLPMEDDVYLIEAVDERHV